jgi:hypothetical protein
VSGLPVASEKNFASPSPTQTLKLPVMANKNFALLFERFNRTRISFRGTEGIGSHIQSCEREQVKSLCYRLCLSAKKGFASLLQLCTLF